MADDLEDQVLPNDDTRKEPKAINSGHENRSIQSSTTRNGFHAIWIKVASLFNNKPVEPLELPVKSRGIDESPNGYPRLGAFIAADQNFLILRRFNYLQARVLLNLQDQLQKYENELDEIDRNNPAFSHGRDKPGSKGSVPYRRRKLLLAMANSPRHAPRALRFN
ncbi:hypothetical protein F5B20DRAFT_539727 [Whalleya microplaca]|nr:hypothetical protein F5B20DRAFT_539727 [Whalleya microplaca]